MQLHTLRFLFFSPDDSGAASHNKISKERSTTEQCIQPWYLKLPAIMLTFILLLILILLDHQHEWNGAITGGCEASERAEQTPGERHCHYLRREIRAFPKITNGWFPGPLVLKIHFSKSGASGKIWNRWTFSHFRDVNWLIRDTKWILHNGGAFKNLSKRWRSIMLLYTHTKIK